MTLRSGPDTLSTLHNSDCESGTEGCDSKNVIMTAITTYDWVYLKQNPSGNVARLHELFETIVHFVVARVRDIRRTRRSILTHTHTHTHTRVRT